MNRSSQLAALRRGGPESCELGAESFLMLANRATKTSPPTRNDVRTYKGIGVSPGIAIGRAVIIERREASVFRVPIREEEVASEVTRFLEALDSTRDQLLELKQKVSRSMGDEYASIFEAHAM